MNNAAEARRLLRGHRYGALSTLSKKLDGHPFGSITPYLADHDGSLLILISDLAEHTKNIVHDPRASLITHNQRDANIQMQGRVTLIGNAQRLSDQQDPCVRYVRHFPEAADLLKLDFSFYRLLPVAIRHIGGVGRIHWVRMDNYTVAQAAAFSLHEEALLLEINDRQQESVHRLLQQVHGADTHDAQVIGLDCDGLDIRNDGQVWRLDFAVPLTEPGQLKPLSALRYHLP